MSEKIGQRSIEVRLDEYSHKAIGLLNRVPYKGALVAGLLPFLEPVLQAALGDSNALAPEFWKYLANKRWKRFERFLMAYEKGEDIDQELLKSEEFIECAYRTCKASLAIDNQKKVDLYAKLLIAAATTIDSEIEFDLMLRTLDGLADHDLEILDKIFQYEERYALAFQGSWWSPKTYSELGEKLTSVSNYWPDLEVDLCNSIGIHATELMVFIARIQAMGVFVADIGLSTGHSTSAGYVSSLYLKLRKAIYP